MTFINLQINRQLLGRILLSGNNDHRSLYNKRTTLLRTGLARRILKIGALAAKAGAITGGGVAFGLVALITEEGSPCFTEI